MMEAPIEQEPMRVLSHSARLWPVDRKRNIEHHLSLPEGVTHLRVVLEWHPRAVPGITGTNDLSLTLFDPGGARGAGHNRPNSTIELSATRATPGYLPGPLPAGPWLVVLDTHMIVAPLTYSIVVDASFTPTVETGPHWAEGQTAARGPGWYRGDLHSHTLHSDGDWDIPDLIEAAHRQHLDFLFLTDHNTVSGHAQLRSLASDELLTACGLELTTYYGHALALGVHRWIDWRAQPGDGSMAAIAEQVGAAGGVFIIAHPMSPGDPVCTGCDWRYHDMMPGSARCVEIWNGGAWGASNELDLALWYAWLNRGHRMVATAGTDVHGPQPLDMAMGLNVVYAEALNERAILGAISRGHLYLSCGPRLDVSVVKGEETLGIMGDVVPEGPNAMVVRWSDAPSGGTLRWVCDGKVLRAQPISPQGEDVFVLDCTRWCVVELRDGTGAMSAISNPCFFGDDWR